MAEQSMHVITDIAGAEALRNEWAALHLRSRCGNPFAHPSWMIAWARFFSRPGELMILAVRQNGELNAVAPLYIQHMPGHLRVLRALGTGRAAACVELPQVLAAPSDARSALRTIVGWIGTNAHRWSWSELPIAADQGWLEPAWLDASFQGTAVHKGVRACVVAELPEAGQQLETVLKRNVKESLRRGRNRLKKTGHAWSIEVLEGENAVTGVEPLLRLHRSRAAMPGKPTHPAHFATDLEQRFLYTAVAAAGSDPGAEILLLRLDGRVIAARLVLRAPGEIYLAWSGLDPAFWEFSAVTLLTAEAMRRAIERGDRRANLSTGPDTSKLRWSERLEVHSEFLLPSPGRANRYIFGTYLAASAAAAYRREYRLRRTAGANT